jgi:hypothetical protein
VVVFDPTISSLFDSAPSTDRSRKLDLTYTAGYKKVFLYHFLANALECQSLYILHMLEMHTCCIPSSLLIFLSQNHGKNHLKIRRLSMNDQSIKVEVHPSFSRYPKYICDSTANEQSRTKSISSMHTQMNMLPT